MLVGTYIDNPLAAGDFIAYMDDKTMWSKTRHELEEGIIVMIL